MKKRHRTVSRLHVARISNRNVQKSSLDRIILRESPLAECEVWGCHNVTTVGPLCLDHWTLKANMRELQKTVYLASPIRPAKPTKRTLTDGWDN